MYKLLLQLKIKRQLEDGAGGMAQVEHLSSKREVLSLKPCTTIKKKKKARHQWLMPISLMSQEAEIRRIVVQRQPRQIVFETLS
jgi:hypothetical protein